MTSPPRAPAAPMSDAERVAREIDNVLFALKQGQDWPRDQQFRALTGWLDRLRAQPAGVVVPAELILWLLGEGDSFECPPEQCFRGRPAPYFWRTRLHEAVADQLAALKKDPTP